MGLHHTDDPDCPLCDQKLTTAHPILVSWFKTLVKPRYQNAHISWAWRGRDDQEQAFADHKTRLHWPDSAHNEMNGNKPESLALDIFQIDEDGVARFSPFFYAVIARETEDAGLPILWGGKWKSIGDSDHFQVNLEAGDGKSVA